MRSFLFFTGVVILSFASCNTIEEQPISEKEATTFAKAFEDAITLRDFITFKSFINEAELSKKVAAESNQPKSGAYLNGIRAGLKQKNLSKEIIGTLGQSGKYKFLHAYEKDKRYHVIFRLYGDGLNYHDMELIKTNNKIQVADIFFYTSGENISKSLARTMGALEDVTNGSNDDIKKYTLSVSKLKKLISNGEYQRAKSLYDALPPKLRNDKLFMIMNIQACSNLEESIYQKAMDDFRTKYKNDAASELILLDAFILKQDYESAITAVNVIDKSVGGDPFLNYYRGMFYGHQNKNDSAIQAFEKLYTVMPDFEDGVVELIAAHLTDKNEKRALELTNRYKANSRLDKIKLNTIALLHPDFAKKAGIEFSFDKFIGD